MGENGEGLESYLWVAVALGGSSGEGRRRRVRGEGRPAVALVRCGGALAMMG